MSRLETGAITSSGMRDNYALEPQLNFPYPLRGTITGVFFKDELKDKTTQKPIIGQTVADVKLMGLYPTHITKVPFSLPKVNATTGEEWTPEPGDIVIVQFIGGNFGDPIITGMCNMSENSLQGDKKETSEGYKRRYHFRCNKTDVVVDKDGNRITYVEGNETVEVGGGATLSVSTGDVLYEISKGNLTINVNKGDAKITIQGSTYITTSGETEISSYGNVTLNSAGDTEVNSSGSMKITSGGPCKLTAIDDIDVMASGDVTVAAAGDAIVTAKGSADVAAMGALSLYGKTVAIESMSMMTIKTPMLKIKGEVVTTGNIRAGFNVADNIGTLNQLRMRYNFHKHVSPLGITGPPLI